MLTNDAASFEHPGPDWQIELWTHCRIETWKVYNIFLQLMTEFVSFQNNPKDLDPSYKKNNNPKDLDLSYKMNLDLWDC